MDTFFTLPELPDTLSGMIRTSEIVFLGVVVNPVDKRPVFVIRDDNDDKAHVAIRRAWANPHRVVTHSGRRLYPVIGGGSLDHGQHGMAYTRVANETGYPRAHTSKGVAEELKGGGYGTTLYSGLALFAKLIAEGEIERAGIVGRRAGISSTHGTRDEGGGRTASADAWWARAVRVGLAEELTIEAPETTEEAENQDLEDYMSSRGQNRARETISEAVSEHSEWYPTSISLKGDLERTVPGEEMGANIYTFKSAVDKNLVCVIDPMIGDVMTWAAAHGPDAQDDEQLERFKSVILALNVAHDDPAIVEKLARMASFGGATDEEIQQMIMRNYFQVDSSLTEQDALPPSAVRQIASIADAPVWQPQPSWQDARGGADALQRIAGDASGYAPGAKRSTRIPVGGPPMGGPVRNPPAEPDRKQKLELERAVDDLEERRAELGWDKLKDMP